MKKKKPARRETVSLFFTGAQRADADQKTMFRKTIFKKTPQRLESVTIKTGIELLAEQVEEAKGLLNNRPILSKDHQDWNNTTREYLIKIYGAKSPNIGTIVSAPGQSAVWMGMSDATRECYEASSIENKIYMLENCIVSLKLKAKRSEKAEGDKPNGYPGNKSGNE